MTVERIDYVIVGSGIAGLTFALNVADGGRVVMVTKKNDAESATNLAQGGIAAVMARQDSFDQHIEDTLAGGVGLCSREAVEIAVRGGPDAVGRLTGWGAKFSTESDPSSGSSLALGREGGHSVRRIVHAADMTGREIESALLGAVDRHPNIEVFEDHIALDLVTTGSGSTRSCVGVHVLDERAGIVKTLTSATTVLATGGCGKVYLYTTNPDIATGDGI
ncbi:FAD-binding protein, partial [bacterium]|nr:FAD-binding protein [bacterium]